MMKCALLPAIALAGLMLACQSAGAVTAADAPGYGQAPICLMGDCDQVQASHDAGASAASINTAGLGQGGRMSPGTSRPISMKLPNGGYQCITIRNNCSGEIFIPANSSGEWSSFLASSCVSASPCSYGEVFGAWDPWSASCGPASHSRWIACRRDQDGRYVDASFCSSTGIETETTCFSCPQTTCTTNADESKTCVTDDQCGNTQSTYSPPPPPTIATVRADCLDGEKLCEANGPESYLSFVGGVVTDNLTYACVRRGYKYSYGGWGFRHAQCDSCVYYSARQTGPDRTDASSWQVYASNHGCDSCGPYVQSFCGNRNPANVDATCSGLTTSVAGADRYVYVYDRNAGWGLSPDALAGLTMCFEYNGNYWPASDWDQATGYCRKEAVVASMPGGAHWGQYVMVQSGCYSIGSVCTPDGWRSETSLLYGSVWGDPRFDVNATCSGPNVNNGGGGN